ncbi:hypothetical protein [Nonomuraea glycinis]|uniref:hypothetical protein n=1 Tax=Nonomuraea glycinis TaxID=2047744 RepID=UPI002E0F8E2C|nr:hypothetical protein OHA68_14370 [Nonomuraea glycinis]
MKARLGVCALVLLFLAGLWLVASPFVVGYQPAGAPYTAATVNSLWLGGGLAGLSFITLVLYAADALRELTTRAEHPTDA